MKPKPMNLLHMHGRFDTSHGEGGESLYKLSPILDAEAQASELGRRHRRPPAPEPATYPNLMSRVTLRLRLMSRVRVNLRSRLRLSPSSTLRLMHCPG